MKRVCIIGCGAIGSLYAAHLARRTEVWAAVRRPQHAQRLRREGLRVSGTHDFHVSMKAASDAQELPSFDLGIVCTKATQTEAAFAPLGRLFDDGAVISAQNGLGGEEILAKHTRGYVMRATTFMSGSRIDDNHVKYELDTATWLGPFEPTATPFSLVREAAELIQSSGLKAEALEDARPAQWSKLIFNASVNSVAALTELPHCRAFSDISEFESLGRLLRDLIDESKAVAKAAGVDLHEDPWEMNCIGAETDHPPSMLNDVRSRVRTEIDFLAGAIAKEAQRLGVPAPLNTALFRLVKGKEASWRDGG